MWSVIPLSVATPTLLRISKYTCAVWAVGVLGILFKIETRQAFECLPHLLLTVMRSAAAGVMIARGDLAVECGYERTGELQEEIMWMAEAAHVPVIWATQVLENVAKTGQPSRAEITDAAMAERAECVMLNKGPYVVQAVQMLDDVLIRMQAHQMKKVFLLRQLDVARSILLRRRCVNSCQKTMRFPAIFTIVTLQNSFIRTQ